MSVIGSSKDIKAVQMKSPEVKGASMKALIGPEEGWDDHVLRVVRLEDQGHSPKHQHPWPHFNYILEGEGELFIEGSTTPLKPGDYAVVPPDTLHQYRSTSEEPFTFICIVPQEGHQ